MAWLLLAPAVLWLAILLLYLRPMRAAWREPTLRHPVLIIESDDWGPGPPGHALALRRLTDCLIAFRDNAGRSPVMTLGLTLSLPDGAAMEASGFADYRSRPFTDPAYSWILEAIRAGIAAGVFAPQLHGMAHYWPDVLLRAARSDTAVRDWLARGDGMETESLPSPLQSRWIDATSLPSSPLPPPAIEAAAREEIACFTGLLGSPPEVAVPPTFIWTSVVERAWAEAGLRCLVTPGRRYDCRDGAGRPTGPDGRIHNGERGVGGLLYLVRDDYFEPAYGHQAGRALAALEEKTAQGRPCLLETHRFNFTGEQAEVAFSTLGEMLTQAQSRFPNLRFTSSAELAKQYRDRGDWLEPRLGRRYAAWLARLRRMPRFWKLARLSGLGFVLAGVGKCLA